MILKRWPEFQNFHLAALHLGDFVLSSFDFGVICPWGFSPRGIFPRNFFPMKIVVMGDCVPNSTHLHTHPSILFKLSFYALLREGSDTFN